MATTTNFGWPTPDNTSYVRNGASDMRTLGSAIDTSMADLKGGTTGQVLKKNTNTDMDFVWAAESGGISPTIFDAKGDLIGASAADTAARLAVGSDDQVLVADSSASTGLAWKSYGAQLVAGKNKILNGDFSIWQRGTTFTNINTDGTYTADRFYVTRGGGINVTKRSIGSYNPPANFGSYAEIVNQSANNPFLSIEQTVETLNADTLAGQPVTFSLYARAHANTTASKTLTLRIAYSTSVDTKGGSVLVSTNVSLAYGTAAADWQRFTVSGTIPANARSVTVTAVQTTLAVGDGLHITGVQLEAGSVATPFTTATGNPASELAACQWYFKTITADGVNNGAAPITQFGLATGTGTFQGTITFAQMRTAPSVSFSSSNFRVYDCVNAATTTTGLALSSAGSQTNGVIISASAPSLTQYRPYYLIPGASTVSYVYLNSEL